MKSFPDESLDLFTTTINFDGFKTVEGVGDIHAVTVKVDNRTGQRSLLLTFHTLHPDHGDIPVHDFSIVDGTIQYDHAADVQHDAWELVLLKYINAYFDENLNEKAVLLEDLQG